GLLGSLRRARWGSVIIRETFVLICSGVSDKKTLQ
ncbi:unnamed protein product, partial [marine sediment metagenome]